VVCFTCRPPRRRYRSARAWTPRSVVLLALAPPEYLTCEQIGTSTGAGLLAAELSCRTEVMGLIDISGGEVPSGLRRAAGSLRNAPGVASGAVFVAPGDTIDGVDMDDGFLRGHGTQAGAYTRSHFSST
jgi:hypothetical protein